MGTTTQVRAVSRHALREAPARGWKMPTRLAPIAQHDGKGLVMLTPAQLIRAAEFVACAHSHDSAALAEDLRRAAAEPATEPLLATVANMRKLAEGPVRTPGAIPFAYSPHTFERYAASPGDYFTLGEDEPLTDSDGEPMVLAYAAESVVIVDAR